MLKILLDSFIKNFKCPNCQSKINENNLEIVGAAGTSINIDVNCTGCQKHTFVKVEVSQINLGNVVDLNPENIDEFKQKLYQKLSNININGGNLEGIKNIQDQINDKEILELRDILKDEHIKVQDLLGGE